MQQPGLASSSDLELVQGAREGNERAFEALVRRHQDSIYGLVMRMVGERDIAEELTQDTFVRAWRNLDGFRGEAQVSTWLYRIAVNLLRDRHASRAARERRSEVSLDDVNLPLAPLAASEPSPVEALEAEEAGAQYRRALADLDPDHRAAFLLRHQEGLAPAEIAGVLGISESNAKVRVHRARRMILDMLRKAGYEA
jgi:RNA polymerase sigma-70 factor (ECF subfamily)